MAKKSTVEPQSCEAQSLALAHPFSAAIVGPFGPAQLTCIRSWKAKGMNVVFIHLAEEDIDVWQIHSLVDDYLRLTTKQYLSEEGRALLFAFLVEKRVNGVTALSYSTIRRIHQLSQHSEWPESLTPWVVRYETLDFLEAKREQTALAESCGMCVAATAYLATSEDVAIVDFPFPWVLRPDGPNSVSPMFKVEFIESISQFANFLSRSVRIQKPVVAQPFLNGTNIVVHGARSATGAANLHYAFEVPSMLDGVSLTLRPIPMPEQLAQSCKEFVDRAGIVGVYHFEFRQSDVNDKYYFLEINGRLGGTTGKVFRLNYDEPWLMAQCFNSDSLQPQELTLASTASNRLAILKAIRLTFNGRLTVFDYPSGKLHTRLANLFLGVFVWRDEILYRNGLRSGLLFLIDSVRRRLA